MTPYVLEHAPSSMSAAASAFEERYGIRFATLTHFSAETLAAMHTAGADEAALMESVVVASESDPAILACVIVLTRIANEREPALADRIEYFSALQDIYRAIGGDEIAGGDRLLIAPEREGRILAEALGWLRPQHDLAPHAKRIPYEHGLLVGVSDCSADTVPRKLVCVDGAIASGATLIALLDLLAAPAMPVEIYTVHAAREGVRAILRFGATAGLSIRIHAGHVTDGLSPKFYAVDGDRLIVGDLGDMIDSVSAAVAEQ